MSIWACTLSMATLCPAAPVTVGHRGEPLTSTCSSSTPLVRFPGSAKGSRARCAFWRGRACVRLLGSCAARAMPAPCCCSAGGNSFKFVPCTRLGRLYEKGQEPPLGALRVFQSQEVSGSLHSACLLHPGRTFRADRVEGERGVGPNIEQANGATPVQHALLAICKGWGPIKGALLAQRCDWYGEHGARTRRAGRIPKRPQGMPALVQPHLRGRALSG